jgi:hypothetical protein
MRERTRQARIRGQHLGQRRRTFTIAGPLYGAAENRKRLLATFDPENGLPEGLSLPSRALVIPLLYPFHRDDSRMPAGSLSARHASSASGGVADDDRLDGSAMGKKRL